MVFGGGARAVGGCAQGGSPGGAGCCSSGGGCDQAEGSAGSWDAPGRDVVGLKLGNHARTFYCDSTGFQLDRGDPIIVEAQEGEAYGFVVQPTGLSRKFAGAEGMKRVLRRATSKDEEIHKRTLKLRADVTGYCEGRVRELKLEMKVIEVEPAFDARRVTCYFTAEERIDFRELVRDMAHRFRCRIEMRQIGARDEAKMRGGYGICGRPLCCTSFLTEFSPISVKMAKRQGLSLNPSKISGLCGRLMCCLRFEDVPGSRPPATAGGGGSRPGRRKPTSRYSSSGPATSNR